MSTTNLRALAVAVAAVIAVLTGVAVGLLSGERTCTVTQSAPNVTTTTAPTTASTADASGGGIGNAQQQGSSPAGAEKPAPPPATTAATNAQAGPAKSCTTDSFNVEPALTAFVGALFAGGVLLLLLLMAARTAGSAARTARGAGPANVPGAPGTPGAPGPGGPGAAGTGRASRSEADRATLVQAAIYVRDRVTSKALADRLGMALRDAGVETLEPTGVRFDPAHHEAGGAAPSDDPSKIGSIAAVEVPGYADRGGRILRAPVVTVYQGGASSTRAARTDRTDRTDRTARTPRDTRDTRDSRGEQR
jgi:GrpE